MRLKSLVSCIACALLLSGLRLPAYATTFVLMDERDLAAASTAVVTGWVTGVQAHSDGRTGGVNTYVTIEPTEIVAGTLPEGEIVLRERGGQVKGRVEKIFGAAEFKIGEQVMVFVSQDADGSLHTTDMAMGKYTVQSSSRGLTTVTRSLGAEVMVLDRATGHLHTSVGPEVVEFGQFVQHVRTAANRSRRPGIHTPPVQLTPPELNGSVPHTFDQSMFTYLGNPSRWFEPDSGQTVLYQIDPTGDARNGLAASRNAVDNALAAWTNVPNSSLVLGDGGLLSAPQPFTGCDGGSRIVFNDPFNEISDPVGCGGILAIGGYCSSGETRTINGTTFQRITLGKVVFNNGWEQCDLWDACDLAEVATHELGHTIGLGHSADDNATMNASAHFDGRCASLESDDIAAAQFVYPDGVTLPPPTAPQPTATSTPVPPTPVPNPTNPSGAANDACTNATTVTGIPFAGTSLTTTASIGSGDPAPACGNGSRGKSVWYRFTAASDGTLTADTFGSSYDTILATYVGSCVGFSPVPNGCNDDASSRQSRVSIQATAGTTYYFMVTAYSDDGGTLSFHVAMQGGASTATPTRTATPQPPTPVVDLSGPTATAVPATPTVTTPAPTPTFTSAPLPPSGLPSDSASTPFDIPSAPSTVTFSTSAATLDPTDPAPACGNRSRSKSVWLRFTAPSNGTLTADTFGSNYDTILAAYGRSGNTFIPVACNDDTGSAQSRVSFQTSAGAAYYFMVTSYNNTAATLVFHLTFQGSGGGPTPNATPTAVVRVIPTPTSTPAQQVPVPPSSSGVTNDVCTTAITLTAVPSSSGISTSAAAAEPSVPGPACGNRSTGKSVWYRYTAPTTTTLVANTYGSTYDTILAAYSGSCSALTPVVCNDDSVGSQSRVSLQVTAGTTYYFQVTAYRNDGGRLNFQLTN